MKITCPVQLKDHQKPVVKQIWNRLTHDKEFSYIDTSDTGLGKTHVTLCLAWYLQKRYGLKVGIIAPSYQSLHSEDGWLSWVDKYGIDIEFTLRYSSIISHKGNISHPWLIRKLESKKKYNYISTSFFDKVASEGLFLIFDEFHKATRKSSTHFACAALVKACKKYSDRCRVGLISHTPGDKEEHYPQILRMLGIVTEYRMFYLKPFTSQYEWEDYSLGQLIRFCSKKNPFVAFDEYTEKLSGVKVNNICKELYHEYLKQYVTFSMKQPKTSIKTTMLNCFLETKPQDLEMINRGIGYLQRGVGWNGYDVDGGQWNMGSITIGLKYIERGKLNSMINYVKKSLKENTRKKFVLCIGARDLQHQYYVQKQLKRKYMTDEMYITLRLMRKYNRYWKGLCKDMFNYILNFVYEDLDPIKPDVMNGKTKNIDRSGIIANFQKSSNDSWCLIISPGVGAESISLHDKHGDYPREILITPDHFHTRVVQSAGRVNRVGVKSDSKIMIIYSKQGDVETSVLNCMVKKSTIAKNLLGNKEVMFPADYPAYIEGEKDKDLVKKLASLNIK